MEYIVDMQGFKQPVDDYVIKELAIIPLNEDSEPLVFLFKEPFPWRRLSDKYRKENEWLKCSYHGISWHSGDIPYTEVGNILRACLQDATKIIVKGSLKKEWLERFKFNVIDITEMGYPALDRLHHQKLLTICTHHNGAYKATCAVHNVKLLKKFYQANSPSIERSVKIFSQTQHLSFMQPEDIKLLSKDFLIQFACQSIESSLHKLPENLQHDKDILGFIRCYEHHEVFRPFKKDCIQCSYQ